jgi:hypothetical protein
MKGTSMEQTNKSRTPRPAKNRRTFEQAAAETLAAHAEALSTLAGAGLIAPVAQRDRHQDDDDGGNPAIAPDLREADDEVD